MAMHEAPQWPSVQWRQKAHECLRLGLLVSADLACFEGHFPGCPVLPGVVQVHWAASLFLREYEYALLFRRMEAVKFVRLLVPTREVSLELKYDPQRLRLTFHYWAGDNDFSCGRIYWGEP